MKNMLKKPWVLRSLYIVTLLTVWEITSRMGIFPEMLFPSLQTIFGSLVTNTRTGGLIGVTVYSLWLIMKGLFIGMAVAILITSLSVNFKWFEEFTNTIVTIFHPLPGIALLPLAILWFGTGETSIVFIIVHSVLWPMILNTITGFRSIPRIYKEVGQNIGLNSFRMVFEVFVPSSFPYILAGLKIGWARAWRALIGAEMVFGAAGLQGGLGWFIYQKRFFMDIPAVFVGLVAIIIIGILVESLLFNIVEKKTVIKWGMTL